MELRFLNLYPDQMNIYADRGNVIFLGRRCEWRGIGFTVDSAGPGDRFEASDYDFIYMGGGQDRDQKLVAGDLVETKQASVSEAVGSGKVMLAVCGGYQLLGESYELDDELIAGLGLVDLKTVREPGPRLIGPASITVDIDGTPHTVAGFENHGGRTYLGESAEPLGKVLHGNGNNGGDGYEGVRFNNLFGTYLHGPLLPKNSWLADHLIELALASRYGEPVRLDPLDETFESAAHLSAEKAARENR